jgi:hypothetical protein
LKNRVSRALGATEIIMSDFFLEISMDFLKSSEQPFVLEVGISAVMWGKNKFSSAFNIISLC